MPAIFSEQQKEKLREQLLITGFELLKQFGYRKMTIDDITKKCAIAKGTFYRFFKSKEDFIYELMIYERDKEKQALLDALSESRETNKPLRIDFDQNVSVVLRVNKEGTIAANFIPHDKAVEQYLRNNIETLKNTFNENDIPYSDLNYSNRGSKQQKEQQRNRQQQQ